MPSERHQFASLTSGYARDLPSSVPRRLQVNILALNRNDMPRLFVHHARDASQTKLSESFRDLLPG